jgi:hypothetical protein
VCRIKGREEMQRGKRRWGEKENVLLGKRCSPRKAFVLLDRERVTKSLSPPLLGTSASLLKLHSRQ